MPLLIVLGPFDALPTPATPLPLPPPLLPSHCLPDVDSHAAWGPDMHTWRKASFLLQHGMMLCLIVMSQMHTPLARLYGSNAVPWHGPFASCVFAW